MEDSHSRAETATLKQQPKFETERTQYNKCQGTTLFDKIPVILVEVFNLKGCSDLIAFPFLSSDSPSSMARPESHENTQISKTKKRPSQYLLHFIGIVFVVFILANSINVQRLLGHPQALLLDIHSRLPKAAKFQSISTYFSEWEHQFENYTLLETSPTGQLLTDLMHGLHARQHVSNCSNSSFVIVSYSTSLGFGAYARHLMVILREAIRADRVMLLNHNVKLFWMKGCPNAPFEGNFECFFRPLSETCPSAVVQNLVANGTLTEVAMESSSTHIPVANAHRPSVVHFDVSNMPQASFKSMLHGFKDKTDFSEQLHSFAPLAVKKRLFEPHETSEASRRLWLVMSAWYLLRLNTETATDVSSVLLEIFVKTNVADFSSIIGIPLRASDKCFGDNTYPGPGEMECVSLAEVVTVAHRFAFAQATITHMIISSEDQNLITPSKVNSAQRNVTFRSRDLHVIRNPVDIPPGTGSTGRVLKKLHTNPAKLLRASLVTLHLQALA